MKTYLLSGFFGLCGILLCPAQPQLVPFASGLSLPVGIVSAGDGYLYVLERRGKIKVLDSLGNELTNLFLDLTGKALSNAGERGLLGMAFSPNYAQNGFFYLNYIRFNGATRISRFSRDANDPLQADPGSEVPLLDVPQPYSNHNGGDLHFGTDGYLYASLGDGGDAGDPGDRAQNLNNYLGKILRIEVDSSATYSIPAANPYANNPNALGEIWSSGWRNPWRFSFDRLTGDMWVGDVGQNQIEEISVHWADDPAGLNFGWRCLEGNNPYNGTGCGNINLYTSPVHTYAHNGNFKSVTGGYVYRGSDHPTLFGHYFFGDYETGEFWSITYENGSLLPTLHTHGELLSNRQLSTFGENNRGELFVAAYNEGKIYQLVDQSTGVDPTLEPLALKFFPNPTQSSFQFQLPQAEPEGYQVRLTTLTGQEVGQWPHLLETEPVLLLPPLSPGLYLVEVNGKRTYRGKLLVSN